MSEEGIPRRKSVPSAKAKDLAKEWGIKAAQALYHVQGTYFHPIRRYPAALLDAHGYILFRSEKDLRDRKEIRAEGKVSVRKGIGSLPGYVRVRD